MQILAQTSHQSGIIGNINPNTRIRPNINSGDHTRLRANLSLFTDTNIADIQTVLKTTDSDTLTLNEVAEIRNVETGEILSRDELISDVLIDASVKHDKQIPFEVSNQPFEKIEVKQC